ncbi:hypothetical protein [Natronorubrum bangense]|uniref:hypothetical protein n=1 Tax=Natronorubrum bangense TaxID=61858 RepID=UPI000A923424|nr:hypothetical protein [Natronorubrum bangense]
MSDTIRIDRLSRAARRNPSEPAAGSRQRDVVSNDPAVGGVAFDTTGTDRWVSE